MRFPSTGLATVGFVFGYEGPENYLRADLNADEGFGSVLIDDQIHIVHQTSYDVWYHVFRTSDHSEKPDTWAIQDERIASTEEPPTQVADIAVRSDGSVVVVFGGPHKIHLSVRSPAGQWSEGIVIDAASEQLSHTMRPHGADTWTTPQRLGDDQPVQWVRGTVIRKSDGSRVYGYVIDAGAFGGSGKNRYRELLLAD